MTNEASELRVSVQVYNGINLSSRELGRAEQEAAKIFQFAGIRITWIRGLLGAEVDGDTPSERWDTAFLQLRIWTRAMVGKKHLGSETLGLCISLENGDALVLADAIRKRAAFGSTSFADLLGLAMAHEIGHLLLRSAAHSLTGIMRDSWTDKALQDDDRGYLRFASDDAESMRREVSRRMTQHSVCQRPDC